MYGLVQSTEQNSSSFFQNVHFNLASANAILRWLRIKMDINIDIWNEGDIQYTYLAEENSVA